MPTTVTSARDLTIDLAIRYGFQVLGALVILGVGLALAHWLGGLTDRWLRRQTMEPPLRTLTVRVVRVVVLLFTLVVALDKFGFQIAPLVAGIGVAGLGIGIALQGVLSNVVAGLSIIFTKPFRVGEYIALAGRARRGGGHRAVLDDPHPSRPLARGHSQSQDRGRDPSQLRDHAPAHPDRARPPRRRPRGGPRGRAGGDGVAPPRAPRAGAGRSA